MAEAIISVGIIRKRARKAFFAGLPRSAHDMNWHADALPTWLAEYDRCAAQEPKCTRPSWAVVDSAQDACV